MESINYSMDYFIQFLRKSVRHFNIINENYEEFQSEFEKIRGFISSSDSSILKKKFGFLLSPKNFETCLQKPKDSNQLDYKHMKLQLRSIKYLTLIVMHLSKNNKIKNCLRTSRKKSKSK